MSLDDHDIRPAIITNWVKTLMTFIDRVGFPILAFLLMFYVCNSTLKSLEKTVERNNQTMIAINEKLDRINR